MAGMLLVAGATAVAVLAVLAGARRWLYVVEVSGTSMLPTYVDGDRLLAVRLPGRARRGQAVVVRRHGRVLIKRLAAVAGDPVPPPVRLAVAPDGVVPSGRLVVLGDSPGSDSREWGYLPVDAVIGVVVATLHSARSPS